MNYAEFKGLGIDLGALGAESGRNAVRYTCTPKGAKIFGWAGVDGIHFCTVKGYGETIFSVSPMNPGQDCVQPLARDMGDFLRLLLACGDTAALEQAWMWTEAQFEEYLQEYPPTEDQRAVMREIAEKCGLTPMERPWQYLKEVRAETDCSMLRFDKEYEELLHPEKREPQEWAVYFEYGFGGKKPRRRMLLHRVLGFQLVLLRRGQLPLRRIVFVHSPLFGKAAQQGQIVIAAAQAFPIENHGLVLIRDGFPLGQSGMIGIAAVGKSHPGSCHLVFQRLSHVGDIAARHPMAIMENEGDVRAMPGIHAAHKLELQCKIIQIGRCLGLGRLLPGKFNIRGAATHIEGRQQVKPCVGECLMEGFKHFLGMCTEFLPQLCLQFLRRQQIILQGRTDGKLRHSAAYHCGNRLCIEVRGESLQVDQAFDRWAVHRAFGCGFRRRRVRGWDG